MTNGLFHFHRDPSKASAFIIPFDAGVHSYIDHINGKPRLASPHGWRAIQLLKEAQKNEVKFISIHSAILWMHLSDIRLMLCQ